MNFFELAAWSLFAGATGFLSFLHTNLVLQFASKLFENPVFLALFAVSVSFLRLVFESFSSIFLLVPSSSYNASILPAHRMVLKAEGQVALRVTVVSLAFSLLLSILALPVLVRVFPVVFVFARPFVPFALLAVVVFSFCSEKSFEKLVLGLVVFLLSGALGFLTLSFPVVKEPLFPLLTGLFGLSSVLSSLTSSQKIPPQKKSSAFPRVKWVVTGCFFGAFSSFLPAMTPAFLSSLAFMFFYSSSERDFLSLNASIISSKMFYDFVAVYAIGKSRSGAAVLLSAAVEQVELSTVVLTVVLSFATGLVLLETVTPFFLRFFSRVRAKTLNFFILVFLVLSLLFISGPLGLLIAGVAASIGLLPILLGVKRSFSIGALIVPTLAYYFGLSPFLAQFVR
ncbi:MAG: tripartite tricarboxylate transporter permease [Candidatus Micrarchaeia archaeon]